MANNNPEIEPKDLFNLMNEMMVIGSFFKSPNLYLQYGNSIHSKYDFYDQDLKFLYDNYELCFKTQTSEIDEQQFNIFMYSDDARKKKYISCGGWAAIQKMIDMTADSDFANYLDKLKKYSLLRELERKGFPAQKITTYSKFEQMNSEQLMISVRRMLEHIHTTIGLNKGGTVLGYNAPEIVQQWRLKPDCGKDFPFKQWSQFFRGFRRKKLILFGGISNTGKSRITAYLIAYYGILHKVPILVIENEMTEEEIFAAVLTAVCNNKPFGFEYNIPERNIVANEYDSEEQFQQAMEVAEWVKARSKIHFVETNQYDDANIEQQLRKHQICHGIEFAFYDVLKSTADDQNWEALVTTTTKLKDLANELDIGIFASYQMTDMAQNQDIFDMSSLEIANSKAIFRLADSVIMYKPIALHEYGNYMVQQDDDFGTTPMDNRYSYAGMKVIKNRAGARNMVFAYRIDLDLNTWKEIGFLKKQ